MKGEIQNLLVSTAVAQDEFGPIDLFLLCWALPLCCVSWGLFRWTSLLQGWLSNSGIGPGGEERTSLATFSNKSMSKPAQAQCLKVKPSRLRIDLKSVRKQMWIMAFVRRICTLWKLIPINMSRKKRH